MSICSAEKDEKQVAPLTYENTASPEYLMPPWEQKQTDLVDDVEIVNLEIVF